MLVLALSLFCGGGGNTLVRADDGVEPLQEALSHLRQRATTEVFTGAASVSAYAQRRIQEYKPHKALSDFLPTEFLEFGRGTEREAQVLQGFYEAYDEEYLVLGEVTDITTRRLLLLAMGADSHENLSMMEATLSPTRRARYWLELTLARGRVNEACALWSGYLADPRVALKKVRIYRFSEQRPQDLYRLLLIYRTAGFKVEVSTVDAASMERDVAGIQHAADAELDRLVTNVPVADREETRGMLPRLRAAVASAKERALLAIGMLKRSELIEYQTQPAAPKGWWTRLKDFGRLFTREFREVNRARTALDKVLEFALAGGTVAFTTWAVDQSLQRDMAHGEIVNTVLPLVYAALDKLIFVYNQQPLSAFHGQGISFDFRTNRFDKNAGYLLGSNLVHSILYRYGLLLVTNAAFGLDGHWMLGSALAASLFAEGFMSSLRNVYSKGPIQYFLERLRNHYNSRNMRRHAVAAFGIFNALWAVVAMGDIFQWTVGEALLAMPWLQELATTLPATITEIGLRDAMVAMSVVGVSIELSRKRHSIGDALRTAWDRMRGRRLPPCETFLVLQK